MSEYISRKAAINAILKKWLKINDVNSERLYNTGLRVAASQIDNLPAADVAEVVRCRDCRHRDPEDKKCDSGALERAGCVFAVDDDYYCADGERKDGGQEDGQA